MKTLQNLILNLQAESRAVSDHAAHLIKILKTGSRTVFNYTMCFIKTLSTVLHKAPNFRDRDMLIMEQE